ncbi:MAG: ABC transporter ATP-binding protein [Anaerolineae bacterium]|nr:ABC transporter ATP-binding protein [Anaerolineae bacterium]MCO5206259.1 ABC transporter ATP-binding protein [Anaerolineae bacterium]
MSENDYLIQTEGLTRTYKVGEREIYALRGIDLAIGRGQFVSMRGRSGSGKTTLLNIIGGLDRPTAGRVRIDGRDVSDLSDREWVRLRRQQIGFVFQSFSLMTSYSALENVDLMLRLAGMGHKERVKRSAEVLELVGLSKWADHRPYEMSGGQQQRVAIARAIATHPAIILADEPTGELDTATGRDILSLLRQIVDKQGATLLIATHDLTVDTFADSVYELQDGQLLSATHAG